MLDQVSKKIFKDCYRFTDWMSFMMPKYSCHKIFEKHLNLVLVLDHS